MSRQETPLPGRAATDSPRPGGGTTELYPTKTRIALLNDIQTNRVLTDITVDHDQIWVFPNAPDQWGDRVRVTARVRELEQAGWARELPGGAWITTRPGRAVLHQAVAANVAEVATEHVNQAEAAQPSQGQEIPDDQLDALYRQVGGLRDAIRQGYRVGYAAALGYHIDVTDAGVMVGDRQEQP